MPNSIERVFLGWDVPALGAAAIRLIDHYAAAEEIRMDGATVVLPGARAGRRLAELLLEEAERRELRLVPPRMTTIGALPELLYDPEAPLAEPALARRVWALALRDLDAERARPLVPQPPEPGDLRGWTALARQVERLHREVGGTGVRFGGVARRCREGLLFDDSARWEVLAEAEDAYLGRLRALGYADRELARITALEGGSVATDQDLWLVGIVELPAVIRRLLGAVSAPVRALVHAPAARAADFDAEGCVRPGAWLEAVVPIRDERLRIADRPADQAAEALLAIAALDGRFAAEEITIGVPDDEVVPYLEQRFSAAGLPVRYAAGVPLARTGPYRLLDAFAAYLDGKRFDAFAALLRHPDLWRWLRRQRSPAARSDALHDVDACLAVVDGYFGESLPAHLAGGLAGSGSLRAGVQEIVRAVDADALLGRLRGERRLAEWMPLVLQLLAEVYGEEPLDRSVPAERQVVEACERIRAAAAALHRLPEEVDAACGGEEAIRLLLAEAEGEAIPPESERAAIELLGWLELHLDDAPVLVVTGLNEPYLPESVSADAFLPNALRSRLGLIDNDLRYARDAYQLTAILHSRPEVHLIAGRRSATGDPLRPSRLVFAAPGRVVAERVRRLYGGDQERPRPAPVLSVAPAGVSRFQLPPEPELRAPEPISTLRVTDFRLVLQDPYRFALERVLGLDPLNDEARELDGLLFGSFAHDVLRRFWDTDEIRSAEAARIARRLDELLDEAAARRFGSHALPAVLVQVEQLRARLHAFAAWHAGWIGEGWRVEAVEAGPPDGGVPFDVDGEELRLRGRIDRIDHHPETGEWAVFDYKTSEAGEAPDRSHRSGRGDDRRWVDLQLPLYRHLLPALRRPDGAPLIPQGRIAELRLGYILLPRELGAVGAAVAEWSAEELAAADETARTVVRFLRENRFTFDGARAAGFAGDSFAALLGLGQLAGVTDGDDDEGGEE